MRVTTKSLIIAAIALAILALVACGPASAAPRLDEANQVPPRASSAATRQTWFREAVDHILSGEVPTTRAPNRRNP